MSSGTVLIVDDDLDTIEAMSKAMMAQGWRVTVANNLEEAGEALSQSPQIIFLDYNLPGKFHAAFIQEARRDN